MRTRSRSGSTAAASTHSASPYIGEVSNSVVPCRTARATTSAQRLRAFAANVERLPGAHADDGHLDVRMTEGASLHTLKKPPAEADVSRSLHRHILGANLAAIHDHLEVVRP